MPTLWTVALEKQLGGLGEKVTEFADAFNKWKAAGQRGEYDSYLFGKDGAYAPPVPVIHGFPAALRHVHLVPLGQPEPLAAWNRDWARKRRKVSDRALVYASDVQHGHLLIYILNSAHQIASMQEHPHVVLMQKLAKIADKFVHEGRVIG